MKCKWCACGVSVLCFQEIKVWSNHCIFCTARTSQHFGSAFEWTIVKWSLPSRSNKANIKADAQKKISMNSGHDYLQKIICLDLFSFSSFTPLDEILKGLQAELPKHVELRDMTYQWNLASNTLLPGFQDVILSPPTNSKSGLRFVEEMFYEICRQPACFFGPAMSMEVGCVVGRAATSEPSSPPRFRTPWSFDECG